MQTRHLQATESGAIAAAAELLKQGHLVVFPTDTVYGVGGDAFNAQAIEQLYRVKQRPFHKGIPILLADLDDIEKVAHQLPPAATAYINHFWPGPLTLILPKHPQLPGIISANDGVAVRIPDCDVARALIRAAGGAVATSSANLSGQAPAQSGREAMAELGGLVTAVLDNGPSPGGVASTVVRCLGGAPQILRPGPISIHDLLNIHTLSLATQRAL